MPEDTQTTETKTAEPTKTEEAPAKKKTSEGLTRSAAAKVLGVEKSDIAAYNPASQVVVTNAGGKYQVSRNGRAVRHLQGPRLTSVADGVDYSDARQRGPFVGTAAQLNAAAHEGLTPRETAEQKVQRLQDELAAAREELKNS
jgi:hypothetical protein